MTDDERYMRIALRLGTKGLGRTSPNPPVGAVIVENGEIIGKGWHKKAGMPHAEVEAIADAHKKGFSNFRNATIYVTLEPCSHYGKTPPCADLIVSEKFARVIIGTLDPNPLVNGNGVKILKDGGIDVATGIIEREAKRLVENFATFITKKRAFLAVKWAQSLDGKIAAKDGSSRWISSEKSLKFAHKLRNIYDAVIIGSGTLSADNPKLTVRKIRGRNPVRIIIGGKKPIRADYDLFSDNAARTIFITPLKNPFVSGIPKSDIEIWRSRTENNGKISLLWVLQKLASEGYTSALLEGGSKLIGSAISEKIADRIYAIIAPKIVGNTGISAIGTEIAKSIDKALKLDDVEMEKSGVDIIITGKPLFDSDSSSMLNNS